MASQQVYQDGTHGANTAHADGKKPGVIEKIKDLLPGHKAKNTTDPYESTGTTGATGAHTEAYPAHDTHPIGTTHPITGTGLHSTPYNTTGTVGETVVPINERHHGLSAAAGGDRYAAGYLPGEEVGVGGEVRKDILPTIKGLFSKNKTGPNSERTVGADEVHDGGYQHGGLGGITPPTGYTGATGPTGITGVHHHHEGEGIVPRAENALAMGKHRETGYNSGDGYAAAGSAPGGIGSTVASTPVHYNVHEHVGQGAGYEQTAGGYQQTGLGGQQKEGIVPKVEHALGLGKHHNTSDYQSGAGGYNSSTTAPGGVVNYVDTTSAPYGSSAGGYQQGLGAEHGLGAGGYQQGLGERGYEQGVDGQHKQGIVPKVKEALGMGGKHHETGADYQSGAGDYNQRGHEQSGYEQGVDGQHKQGIVPKVKEALGMGGKHHETASEYHTGTGGYNTSGVAGNTLGSAAPYGTSSAGYHQQGAGYQQGLGHNEGLQSGGGYQSGVDHASAPGGLNAGITRGADGMVADIKVFLDNSLPTSGGKLSHQQPHQLGGVTQF